MFDGIARRFSLTDLLAVGACREEATVNQLAKRLRSAAIYRGKKPLIQIETTASPGINPTSTRIVFQAVDHDSVDGK